jgi:hypothetical protein
MRIGDIDVGSHTSFDGVKMIVSVPAKEEGVLDRQDVEQLRATCDEFLAGRVVA